MCEHLSHTDKQATSQQSRFLDACRAFNRAEISKDELLATTARLGFNNVIDAFHIVNAAPIETRFFIDERDQRPQGIRLSDDLFRLNESIQCANLGPEVEARWRLVETAWSLNLARHLMVISYEAETRLLVIPDRLLRRKTITSSRSALNGYQKGKCFYCARPIVLEDGSFSGVDVDHFFPHVLKFELSGLNLDGVWNLVLACGECNKGAGGKGARVPDVSLIERLHHRNDWLINSHHPLRETIIAQTGSSEPERRRFLQSAYGAARSVLIHT